MVSALVCSRLDIYRSSAFCTEKRPFKHRKFKIICKITSLKLLIIFLNLCTHVVFVHRNRMDIMILLLSRCILLSLHCNIGFTLSRMNLEALYMCTLQLTLMLHTDKLLLGGC